MDSYTGSLVIIRPQGNHARRTWENNVNEPPYSLLRELVDGPVELSIIMYDGTPRDAFYNEEGVLRHLPWNSEASRICGHRVVGTMVIVIPDT
jgi:hypothetical protein